MSLKLSLRIPVALCLLLTATSCRPKPSAPEMPQATQAAAQPVKPLRGLVFDEAGIEVVRAAAARGVHQALVKKIFAKADEWIARPEAEVIAMIPDADAVFAYGRAGDPKVDKPWPRFPGDTGLCSWDRPGTVRSPHTGDVYGAAGPGEPYYDPGDGWRREKDGQFFYFKGIWNAWVVYQLHGAVDHLALAYMLTGRQAYAQRALLILDRLATLRVSLPASRQVVIDWPHQVSTEDAKGFFYYMGNIANSRMIRSAYAFDLIANAPDAAGRSAGNPGLSIAENIRDNYFSLYELQYRRSKALSNHGTILLANMITQGVLFGKKDLLREGLEGLRGFLNNTINRDGDYMEVSGSYGRLGRDNGSQMITPLTHYRPENYPQPEIMPKLSGYLDSATPGDDPRWYRTAVRMLYRLPILGRYPQYGDMAANREVLSGKDNLWLAKHRKLYLQLLHWQTTREEWKREIEAVYPYAVRQKGAYNEADLLIYGPALWIDPAPVGEAGVEAPAETSDLMGGKGIAILRSGRGADARALWIRGGINSWHGHDDQMALVPYGHGMVLAGEYGYCWANTPDHLGWGTRSVAHNTVVVDEDLPAPALFKGFAKTDTAPAASVTGFLPTPPAQLVAMRNPKLWSHARLKEYQRSAWLVDVDATRYYFVDLFEISGGHTHDYSWLAPYSNAPMHLEGVAVQPKSEIWTLAGFNPQFRKEPWNAPGKSWGERLYGATGQIKPLPGEKALPVSKWNPAPGNGYGMIWDVKSADTHAGWSVTWPLQDDSHVLRAHFVNDEQVQVIAGKSASMDPEMPFSHLIARRSRTGPDAPLDSRFINVFEVGKPGDWTLEKVSRLEWSEGTDPKAAVAVQCQVAHGGTDYFFSGTGEKIAVAKNGFKVAARNAFVRTDRNGALTAMALQHGNWLEAAGWRIATDKSSLRATVAAITYDSDHAEITLDKPLPPGRTLEGFPAWLNTAGEEALPNEVLRLEEVKEAPDGGSLLRFREQSLVLASVDIETVAAGEVRLKWRHGLAGGPGSLAYRGHAVVPAGEGASLQAPPLCLVEGIEENRLKVSDTKPLRAEQRIDLLLTKPGDLFEMPTTVTLARQTDGRWRLSANQPVRVTYPSGNGPATREFPAGETVWKP